MLLELPMPELLQLGQSSVSLKSKIREAKTILDHAHKMRDDPYYQPTSSTASTTTVAPPPGAHGRPGPFVPPGVGPASGYHPYQQPGAYTSQQYMAGLPPNHNPWSF